MNKKIAIVTFANLPLPATKGGAVETLVDDLCKVNEEIGNLSIDIFSIEDIAAEAKAAEMAYKSTKYIYYHQSATPRLSLKNIIYHLTGAALLSQWMSDLIKQINGNHYDVVIITSIFNELYRIAYQIKTKVVWYLHGDAVPVLGRESCRKISNRCAAIISVSDFVGHQIALTGTNSTLITVRNCTDLKRIDAGQRKMVRVSERDKLGITSDDFVLLYVGRINPIKGVKELVEAFTQLHLLGAKLVIAGAASTEAEKLYLEQISSIADDNVLFSGYIDHERLNEMFEMCDVVAVPSVCNEAAPLAVLEAQECGKLVIASNRGGIPEYADPKMTIYVETDEHFIGNLQDAIKVAMQIYQGEFNISTQQTPMNFYLDFCSALEEI